MTKIYTRSVADVGRAVGLAYALNTIGAVLGSLFIQKIPPLYAKRAFAVFLLYAAAVFSTTMFPVGRVTRKPSRLCPPSYRTVSPSRQELIRIRIGSVIRDPAGG